MFSSKCETFALQIDHLVLLDILFVLKVKPGTFFPIHRCAYWFNLQYIIVSLCMQNYYNETFNMVQSCKSGRALRVGSGLSLFKYFEPISGLHTKLFL